MLYKKTLIGNYLIYTPYTPYHLKKYLFKAYHIFKNKTEKYKNDNKHIIVNKIEKYLYSSKSLSLLMYRIFQKTQNIELLVDCESILLSDGGLFESQIMENITVSLLKKQIKFVLSTIPPIEQFVIKKRFGIDINNSLTLDTIGTLLSLTRERIRQIEKKAMRRLRHPKRHRHLIKYFEYDVKELSDDDLPKNEKFIVK